ncbi:MAG: glycosyltransferase family 4 protein [Sphaerospermopsis sp. SIO1G1]|nr:glycosyltransferase family 4 protein [Sphaerospermopsis sp. SIO1G1]
MKKIYFFAPSKIVEEFKTQNSLTWYKVAELISAGISSNTTSWILTTYLYLKDHGLSCELIDYIPEEGILIADRDTLGNKYPYFGKVMLICTKGDREFHPSAHLHIVHNQMETQNVANFWNSYYIPHWPQPDIIPRLKERGSTVKNIAYIGSTSNYTEEFKSEEWMKAIEEIGCQWCPNFNPNQWNDYSNIDIIVAVRSFGQSTYTHKPASKLVNGWHAGVPCILAPESAFMTIRKSELDFIAINSIGEIIEGVKKLKNNPQLYLSMIQNGHERKTEFSKEKITQIWLDYFKNYVMEKYEEWMKMNEWQKRYDWAQRNILLKSKRVENRINNYKNPTPKVRKN